MKTNVCNKNFYSSSSKNRISALQHSGICFSHVFGNTYGDLYHYAANNPVRYIDPDGKSEEDIVREWLFNAVEFISDNAESDEEKLVAAKLIFMMNNRKIQLDNIQDRYCRNDFPKNKATKRAFFDPYLNTETKQPRNIMVIDIQYTWGEINEILHKTNK